nr:lysoplasmalogenase [Chitinophagaceae bacterium]
ELLSEEDDRIWTGIILGQSHRFFDLQTVSPEIHGFAFYAILWPHLGAMRLPVAVYCLVITIMLLQALATRPGAGDRSFRYFTMGAALFVLSDSVLAFDKFYASYPGLGLVVMATYGCAQWLIVQGSMRSR